MGVLMRASGMLQVSRNHRQIKLKERFVFCHDYLLMCGIEAAHKLIVLTAVMVQSSQSLFCFMLWRDCLYNNVVPVLKTVQHAVWHFTLHLLCRFSFVSLLPAVPKHQ